MLACCPILGRLGLGGLGGVRISITVSRCHSYFF